MVQSLIAASLKGNFEEVRSLHENGADACEQDEEGRNALMTAAESGNDTLVSYLLDAGVPWNAIDKSGRCAGEYATAKGHEQTATTLLEAGVRAELLLGLLERRTGRAEEREESTSYLAENLTYDLNRTGGAVLADEASKAVMMQWEEPIMQAHARAICSQGGDVLNIGFGLGIIDTAIQDTSQPFPPKTHTIIEAHPDVIAKMRADGWHQRPGVTVIEGRWQDVLKELGQYDGIFFDTFSEFYDDLREFHGHLPALLKKNGLYSFFNGLAADNPFFHMVYCEVAKRELSRIGFQTEFISLPIDVTQRQIWDNVSNPYWQLDTYLLPVVQWNEQDE